VLRLLLRPRNAEQEPLHLLRDDPVGVLPEHGVAEPPGIDPGTGERDQDVGVRHRERLQRVEGVPSCGERSIAKEPPGPAQSPGAEHVHGYGDLRGMAAVGHALSCSVAGLEVDHGGPRGLGVAGEQRGVLGQASRDQVGVLVGGLGQEPMLSQVGQDLLV